jgi:calmodulin
MKERFYSRSKFRQIMEKNFKIVDSDGSGFLDKVELEEVLIRITNDMGLETPSHEDVEEVLRLVDENGDGKLSKEEYNLLADEVTEMVCQIKGIKD